MEVMLFAIITAICLVFASFGDLRERMVYTAPIIVIHVMWGAYLWTSGMYTDRFLVCFWIIQMLIYITLNSMSIWGGGDSDLYMLLGDICMVACNGADPTTVGMCVCISLAAGLILSIIIGRFEFACKGEAFKKDSGLAVAPGMAVVMIVLLIKFLIGTVIV